MGYKNTSSLTRIDWLLGFIAFVTEIFLGVTYIFSQSQSDRLFGFITFLEGTFALFGILMIDVIYGKGFDLYPDHFRKMSFRTLDPLIINLVGLFLIQLVLQFPLTVRTWHRALAIMFAGPSEELFFRGLMLAPFIKWGKDDNKYELSNPISKKKKILSISIIEVIGITISATAFTFLHVNYYETPKYLIVVALSGIFLGVVYQKYQDLTANIIAHFMLNTIITFRVFGQLLF